LFSKMSDTQKLAESLGKQVDVKDSEANAAVAILLYTGVDDLELLLVKRAVNPSDPWSGDMALPGGRRHQKDKDVFETVVRETREETGINLLLYEMLGHLQTNTSNRSSSPVHILPFVFLCDRKPEIKLNTELSRFLWIQLGTLKLSRGTSMVKGRETPCFLAMGEVVWGLTFRILSGLLDMI